MIYLLDANILITAANTYYGISRVPEFWSWLQHQGSSGHVKIPLEMYEEVLEGRKEDDELLDWVKNDANRNALVFNEASKPDLVQRVVKEGYANDLTDDEVDKLGRDPFLIAYGLVEVNRCITTTEVSKPSRQRHNRHVPDVCSSLKIIAADHGSSIVCSGSKPDGRRNYLTGRSTSGAQQNPGRHKPPHVMPCCEDSVSTEYISTNPDPSQYPSTSSAHNRHR